MSVYLTLRELYALAYLEGLARKAERPVSGPSPAIPVDDTGRAPLVPLRAPGGDRG